MLKGLTSTFRENCNKTELTYNEYIVINEEQIPIRAKLSDDCYENGNFLGSFILKTIQFETSNDIDYKNKEFEYYKVVNGESIKIGTFITTEVQDNDTTELVKVVGMDYGLKTQVEYTSSLDYESGNVTLLDVWNECCELSGLESGIDSFENDNFIVDSDQFTSTGATIRDVFIGIALSSGSFIKVMNDDKIYLVFKEQTTYMSKNLYDTTINTTVAGMTIIGNGNNVIINGTSTASDNKVDIGEAILPAGTYTITNEFLSGSGQITGWVYYKGSWNRPTTTDLSVDQNTNKKYVTFTLNQESTVCFGFYYVRNRVFDNATIRLQIVEGSTPDYDYEPYGEKYEIIEDYTQLEDKRDTHPISCLRLGLSNVEGENVDLIDPELVEEYGENWLILNDNPFAYTQAKREQLITAIFDKVKGFGYSSFVSKTSFKPYLTCGDSVKFRNKNGDLIDSILLRYTHDYTDSNVEIELSAPSETSATVNYLYPLQAIDIAKRAEIIVDKERVQIEALTDQVTTIQGGLDNTYTKEEMNQLIQTATDGVTNNFINSGGNNLLRNTGLWFEDRSQIEYMYPNSNLFPSDDLYMSADPHWEYWKGNAKKVKEDKASNLSGILLQTGYLEQTQQVRNGTYTLSFKYRKLIELATVNVQINDRYLDLTNVEDTEIIEIGEITAQNISIKIFSDTDDSCIIYDLMLNAGSEKAEYSQHQNETTTDTVNISKGITIQSSDTNTTFKANSDGIRVYNSRDMDTPITEYTDTGMDTNRIKVKEEAEIIQVLWKNVGNNTWISRL